MASRKLSPTVKRPRAEAVSESERPNTQALILDAAEELFAAQGYGGTSIRQIAEAAGVNLGMFHYYWGSKQVLCRAVLERRLGPIMSERMARLSSAVESQAPLETLLLAAMEPSLRVTGATPEQRDTFRSFYGRMLADPSPEVREAMGSIVDGFAKEFMQELHRRCTHIDDREFYWRMVFLFGAFFYAHNAHDRILTLLGAAFTAPPIEDAAQYLVRFVVGGLQADPLTEKAAPARRTRGKVAQR
ncbi:MAG: TetR family transcriptional regulator [Hydrogenophaga sp.]|jgi:AcrR family transcriptional regulator|uniref:TetR/AcrR family transcriptional regulator n=1 Tax=Hydrogenophaga sp. TaxID=1904254 RepID=UPI0026221BE4|nr:TetR family transcriptional regulator [Hydrogenophaga sp.]MCW5672547.1 TetR family transcriptional regulator [Hydrogenophaga sp.]